MKRRADSGAAGQIGCIVVALGRGRRTAANADEEGRCWFVISSLIRCASDVVQSQDDENKVGSLPGGIESA